ncbi:hypothetical protein [Brevibacillus agri]|uniref:hypothetical protein n=1 Tax=Brevibacillus agri TaxID=51101 RepID=UPI0018CF75B1|nr:hypothetical protein [Brevibacillus agri]
MAESINKLESVIAELSARGLQGRAGMVWPVIVKAYSYDSHGRMVYPRSFFFNLKVDKELHFHFKKKSDRLAIHKALIDKIMNGSINIHMYHFGMFCIYSDDQWLYNEDFTEKVIGNRRYQYVNTLPKAEFVSNDDFFSDIYSTLIERRSTHIGEYQRNPSLSQVRMLFTADQFAAWTGRHYSNADWVEPIPGAMDLQCKKWIGEHDPMAPIKIADGWVEGPIILGHEGAENGLRHFVRGVPLHAGRAIHVKFGGGWIEGRYEWSFVHESPIQIHAGEEVIHIREGHIVRIRLTQGR